MFLRRSAAFRRPAVKLAPLLLSVRTYSSYDPKRATGGPFTPLSDNGQSIKDADHGASQLLTKFHVHVRERHIPGIHKSYKILTSAYSNDELRGLISKDTFILAFEALASSGRIGDTSLLKRMFADMLAQLELSEDASLHDSIFRILVSKRRIRAAYDWLAAARSSTSEQWHTILQHSTSLRSHTLCLSILNAMRLHGLASSHTTYKMFFRALFYNDIFPDIGALRSYLVHMKEAGLGYDDDFSRVLQDGYRKNTSPISVEGVAQLYHDILDNFVTTQPRTQEAEDAEKSARLARLAQEKGKWAAASLYAQYKTQGFRASQSTLKVVVGPSTDPRILGFWEELFELKADAIVWTKLIHNAGEKGQANVTVRVYKAALASGVRPTNAMLYPVLRALCSGGVRPPSDQSVDTALQLFREFAQPVEQLPDEEPSQPDSSPTNADPFTSTVPMYNTLLRALCSSSNVKKSFPIAVSLLEEMRSRDISMDPMTSTSLVVLLIRCSAGFEEAFKVYELICRPKDGNQVLDAEGFNVVLHTFCNLSPHKYAIAPSHLYFEIVKDMRNAGYSISSKVYTTLLKQLAKIATQLGQEDEDEEDNRLTLVKSIRRIHQSLVIDPSLNPDVVLWNQLMDAYQRAGCYEEALQVWEALFSSHQYDNASVSIVMDACAYANDYGTVVKIWTKLSELQFQFNQANWNNWLECLCRLGRLDQAMKEMCLEMDRSADGIRPDVRSAQVLLSFASNTDKKEEIRFRIKQYLPSLWKILPEHLKDD